jgi:hypothetical protein
MTQSAERPTHQWSPFAAILTALSVVALYIWDDVLFAGPIVAVTALTGPWVAFVLFAALYSAGSFVLALLAIRAYDRWSRGEPNRLAQWLAQQRDRRRARWSRRLLESSKLLAFVLASFVLGGVLTTFFIRYSGRREGIERIAALSCVIFGITFTAVYTGLAAAIFAI